METIQNLAVLPADKLLRSPDLISLADIEAIMEEKDHAIIPVKGDCLEGAGVMDGGWVAVDFTRRPSPPRSA